MTTDLVLHGLGCRLALRCTGAAAERLAESLNVAWSWCLAPSTVDAGHERLIDAEPIAVRLDDEANLPARLMTVTREVTHSLIKAQAGRLLMLHAGAVSHPRTGASLVYVAPGGTGKTTLSRLLGGRFGYLTDETVGIAHTGAILPYPKPLSVRRPDVPGLKDELAPDSLGLLPAPAAPQVARIVVLVRDPELGSVAMEELSVLNALFAVVGETSSLSRLDRPLHSLADLFDTVGPVLRVRYAEASDIEDALAQLIGGAA